MKNPPKNQFFVQTEYEDKVTPILSQTLQEHLIKDLTNIVISYCVRPFDVDRYHSNVVYIFMHSYLTYCQIFVNRMTQNEQRIGYWFLNTKQCLPSSVENIEAIEIATFPDSFSNTVKSKWLSPMCKFIEKGSHCFSFDASFLRGLYLKKMRKTKQF